MWVFRQDGKLLLNEEGQNEIYWKFPQGGIDEGETAKEAAKRELREEVNITQFEMVAKSVYKNKYDYLPESQIQKGLRGQSQTSFLIFVEDYQQAKIMEKGIRKMEWVTFDKALSRFTFPNQIMASKIIWKEFAPIIKKERTNPRRPPVKNS